MPPSRSKKCWPRPRELAADGVRELVIVAQDTTYYGLDLYGQPRLAELLTRAGAGARASSGSG